MGGTGSEWGRSVGMGPGGSSREGVEGHGCEGEAVHEVQPYDEEVHPEVLGVDGVGRVCQTHGMPRTEAC